MFISLFEHLVQIHQGIIVPVIVDIESDDFTPTEHDMAECHGGGNKEECIDFSI